MPNTYVSMSAAEWVVRLLQPIGGELFDSLPSSYDCDLLDQNLSKSRFGTSKSSSICVKQGHYLEK